MRLIGPSYRADDDANHHMTGGALADWFDLVFHHGQATPTHPITLTAGTSKIDAMLLRPTWHT